MANRPQAEGRPIDGMLLVDKPAGITSHDVVSAARRSLRTRRIGHAGTLDPFATGLLVLLVNHATRLLPHLDGEPKVYDATVVFGTETETDDLTGAPSRTADLPVVDAVGAAIDASSMRGAALEALTGCGTRCGCGTPEAQPERVPMYKLKTFDDEFRAGLGYDQPASPLSSVGIMPAGTGATASK